MSDSIGSVSSTHGLRVALVLDKSETWVRFKRDEVLASWGVADGEVEYTDSVATAGVTNMFGDVITPVVHLKDATHAKRILGELEGLRDSGVEVNVLIVGTVARNSTKRLEKMVADLGGSVHLARQNSRDKTNPASEVIDALHVPQEVKNFLHDYAGDDYSLILGVARSLRTLTPQQQARIGLEDVIIRLPKAPGAVPPWEIDKPLFIQPDPDRMVKMFRRIIAHTHHLVVLSLLKGKLQAAHLSLRLKLLGVTRITDIADALGAANNYQFKAATQLGDRLGVALTKRMLDEVLEVEAQVKGGSRIDGNVLVEMTLLRMCLLVKHHMEHTGWR